MTRLAHSRTWYFLALSFPEDIAPELLACRVKGVPVAGLGEWEEKPRDKLTEVLFDERRYLHPHAWPLLEQQRYLQIKLREGGVPLRLTRLRGRADGKSPDLKTDGGPFAKDAHLRIEEVGLHLFDVGVAVLAIAVFSGPKDNEDGKPTDPDPGINLADDLWFTNRFRQLGVEWKAQATTTDQLAIAWSNGQPEVLLHKDRPSTAPSAAAKPAEATPSADPSEQIDNWLVRALLQPLQVALRASGATLRHSGDQRMFVHRLVAADPIPHHAWPALLWIDHAPTSGSFHPDSPRLEPTTAAHTDDRWYPGTRCGFTRYSAVWATTPDFFQGPLKRQHERVYYSLVLHVLVQRRALLDIARASAEAANLTRTDPNAAGQKISAVHARLLRFVGAVWVRHLSHQEQGIDIGDRLRTAMGLDTLLDDLRAEVGGLAAWHDNDADRKAQEADRAAYQADRVFQRSAESFATIAGALGVYAGFLGANFNDFARRWKWLPEVVAAVGFVVVAGIVARLFWQRRRES